MINRIVLIQPQDPEGTVVVRDHSGKFGILEKKSSSVRDSKFPPLDLAYSASLLERDGFSVSIIDAPTLGLGRSQILREAQSKHPDLIIVNSSGVTFSSDSKFAVWMKKTLQVETAMITPTYMPEEVLAKSGIDIFIRGEVEQTVLEMCKKYPDLAGVQGTIIKKDGKFLYNPERPLMQNLDELPFPAYHLLPMKKYSHQLFGKKRFFSILGSRGCPFGCIYCLYPAGYGAVWRGRSPENVLKEMEILEKEHKVKAVLFRDQVFNYVPKRAEEICDGMIKRKIGIAWRCEGRADFMNKNLMLKMKNAGCEGVYLGVESGDPQILKSIAKRGLTVEKVKEVFKDAREVGLETIANFMIGFPGETKEAVANTFALAKEIRSKRAWFTSLVPYPGTKLYDEAVAKGWIVAKGFDDFTARDVVMRNDSLSAEEIRKAVDEANVLFSKDNTNLLKTVFSAQGIISAVKDPRKAIRFTIGRLASRKARGI